MKYLKYYIQVIIGLGFAFLIMCYKGIFNASGSKDIILIIGDGFTIVSFLYLSVGALIWLSTTGFFDIFSYALKKGAHMLIPGRSHEKTGNYYDYKVEKVSKRKHFTEKSALIIGAGFLVIGIIFTIIWYQ